MSSRSRPRLSVIICAFDMAREAPRTITSATPPYQREVEPDDYEVIVVDNGSTERLSASLGDSPAPNVTIVDMPEPHPSPVFAMNWAARELARGEILLFAIDGARIFSDGIVARALAAHDLVEGALAYTLSYHLGPKPQMDSVADGYDQTTEDHLLARHDWPDRPSSLFEMSVLAGSSRFGFFRPPAESNGFAVTRRHFEELGGYDERFTSPGGGLGNLEMFGRHATAPNARPVCLFSEGTFHQVHGGIATSGRVAWGELDREHERIFGSPFELPEFDPVYFGPLRAEVLPFLEQSTRMAQQASAEPQPLLPEPTEPAGPPARQRPARRFARLRPRQ